MTSLRFCCAANVVTVSVAREPDVYRDCSNRSLGRAHRNVNRETHDSAQPGGVSGYVFERDIQQYTRDQNQHPYDVRRMDSPLLPNVMNHQNCDEHTKYRLETPRAE